MVETRSDLDAALAEIEMLRTTPLEALVQAFDYHTSRHDGETIGYQAFGTASVSQPDGTHQTGGDSATTIHDPQYGIIAHKAVETHVHGAMKVFAGNQSEGVYVNGGLMNPQLVPPVNPETAKRYAPTRALVVVKDDNAGEGNAPVVYEVPHVLVPQHTHPTVVGPTGPAQWGTPEYQADVRGIELQYMVGPSKKRAALRPDFLSELVGLLK